MAMSKERWIIENEEKNSITSRLRKRDCCIASTDDASVRVEHAVPFSLHVNPNCDPAQLGGNVSGSLLSRQLYHKTCDGKTRATTQLCLREIHDVLAPHAHRRMSNLTQLPGLFNEAGDGHRPNLIKKARNQDNCDHSDRHAPPSCIDKPRVDGILGVLGTHRGQQCKRQRLLLWCKQIRRLRWTSTVSRRATVLSTRVRAPQCKT